MRDVLLVGCGAEIGSLLLAMNDPARDQFSINAVLTNRIDDRQSAHQDPLASLYARIVLADPRMLDAVAVDAAHGRILVRGRPVDVLWGDADTVDLRAFGREFGACIVATSKAHVGDRAFMQRFRVVSTFVLGAAEARGIPALYPCLIGAPEYGLGNAARRIGDHRVFALGSCQSNGWQGQLRGLLEAVAKSECVSFNVAGVELDIVHPDTPQGRLGTKSIGPRDQDARNNLRPSASQVETAMQTLFPGVHALNTISLRTLTMPPGYQIARFFFRYERKEARRFTRTELLDAFAAAAETAPSAIRLSDTTLGSRAFEFADAAAVMLTGERFFRYADNPFAMAGPSSSHVSELITQAYVHNTRGYCRSVLNAVRHLLTDPDPRVFFPVA